MNRCLFFESISGITYPEMLVNFFDQFVALKQIVEDSGKVNVLSNTENSITFSIIFNSQQSRDIALNMIQTQGGSIIIYGRIMPIKVEILTDTDIKVEL